MMFHRKEMVCLEVSGEEMRFLRACLMRWRNKLLTEGRVTDPIDEMLEKLMIL